MCKCMLRLNVRVHQRYQTLLDVHTKSILHIWHWQWRTCPHISDEILYRFNCWLNWTVDWRQRTWYDMNYCPTPNQFYIFWHHQVPHSTSVCFQSMFQRMWEHVELVSLNLSCKLPFCEHVFCANSRML